MDEIARYYEILDLQPGASPEEVKQAYRELVKVWHPDRFSHDPKLIKRAHEKLKEINEAYSRLQTFQTGSGRSYKSWEDYKKKTRTKTEDDNYSYTKAPPKQPPPTDTPKQANRTWPIPIWLIAIIGFVILKITSTQLSKSPKIPKSPTEIAAPFAPSMKPSASLNSPIQAKPSDFLNNIEKELSLSPQPIRKGEATTTNRTQLPLSKKETIPKKVTINHDNPKELGRPDVKNPESPTNIARDYFTIGSSKDEVIAVQGTPTEFNDLVWHYGYSKVYFQDGHVKSWDILYSNPLKVKMIPQKTNKNPNDYFTVGSSKDEVLAVQGTPTELNESIWNYGYSKVYFQDGYVKSWDILSTNPLKVKMTQSKSLERK